MAGEAVELVSGLTVHASDSIEWVLLERGGERRHVPDTKVHMMGAEGAWRTWKPDDEGRHARQLARHEELMTSVVSRSLLERPALAAL